MASPTPSPITKAIFPVAGLGTRFLPATKAQPKEMLPVVDKPLIQYAVEEAYEAGVREMIFVTGRHKRPIEDHFDMTFELEVALENAGKQELLDVVRSVKPDDMECIYVRQAQALGLGHAVQELAEARAQLRVGQGQFDIGLKETFLAAAVIALALVAEGKDLLAPQQPGDAVGQLDLAAHAARLVGDLVEDAWRQDVAARHTQP